MTPESKDELKELYRIMSRTCIEAAAVMVFFMSCLLMLIGLGHG